MTEIHELKNYDPNIRWGTHTIKVKFQQFEYKGHIIYESQGNVKGIDALPSDIDNLYDVKFQENIPGFQDLGEDWFKMTLENNDGEKLLIEDEWDNLGEYVVGLEIIGFEETDGINW